MGMGDILLWPFAFAFGGAMMVIWIFLLAFWIWMIVDCAKRKYRNDLEKIIWILVIIFTGLIGALVYYLVIKLNNPKGLAKK